MKLKTKLSKLRHDGHITDAEYSIIINVLNKFSTQPCEENTLKFYYVESLDDYWIGKRLDTMYYAEWDFKLQAFVWTYSKYLPWGEHVVEPNTLWKEYTYPSEPKEISFNEWIKGFLKKHGIEQQSCEDAISRAEAIKEFQIYREYSSNRSNADWVDRIETVLMHLPPVTPQAKPCEDVIGMDAVIEWLKNKDIIKLSSQEEIARKELKELSSVTPQDQQPCETPRTNLAKTSQDCISRDEAIRVAEQGQIQGYEWQFTKLCNLPSVIPKTESCEDCISRAEVLKYAQLIRDDEGIVHEMVHVDDIKYATPMTWSGWTPATQPPEPDTAVLLYVKYKSSGQWTYQLGMWNDSKQSWEDWRTPYQLEEEFEIIEWMETPER